MKKVIKIVSFILITLIILALSYQTLSWKDTTGEYVSNIEQLKNTPNDTIDVVFVGSSHVYCGFAPHALWNNTGIASFDLSISGMDRYSAYYYTKYLLKTQKPKVVAVDLFPITFEGHLDQGNEYRNMMSMPVSKDAIDLAKNYSVSTKEESEVNEAINNYLLRWPIVHSRYKELKKGDFLEAPENSFLRGEGLVNNITPVDLNEAREYTDIGDLTKEQIKWIDDFVKLSEDKGFKLIFMVAPYAAQYHEMLVYNAVEEYVSGIQNVDFISAITETDTKFDFKNDFADSGHLNASGAVKLTKWFYAKELKDLGLKNHKGDAKYENWNQDATYQACLNVNANIEKFIEESADSEAVESIMSSGHLIFTLAFNENWSKYPIVSNTLKKMGYKDGDFKNGGVIVLQGNNVLLVHDGIGEKEKTFNYDRYTSLKVSGNGVFIDTVKIGTKELLSEDANVSLVLWDINVKKPILEKDYH